jgi:hypothetical protein
LKIITFNSVYLNGRLFNVVYCQIKFICDLIVDTLFYINISAFPFAFLCVFHI